MFAKACYGDDDASQRLSDVEPFRVDAGMGRMLLSMHLPFVARDEVQLGRTENELIVTIGPHRRAVLLPDSLVRRTVSGARFVDDRLVVEFQ
jgi:arsenite-transporting ATPase